VQIVLTTLFEMRIALAQINPTVGDLAGNQALIMGRIQEAKADGADLVVFPELALVGYPPKDLLLKPGLIDGAMESLRAIAAGCHGITAVVGLPTRAAGSRGRCLHNSAAWLQDGQILQIDAKRLLPTYDVFDELRYFEPGGPVEPVTVAGKTIGLSICEDLWNDERVFPRPLYHDDPVWDLAQAGVDVIINLAASPFVRGKHAFRLNLIQQVAKKHQLPVLYCNQVGGNDELVFDGGSCAVNAVGGFLGHAKRFESDLVTIDLGDDVNSKMNEETSSAPLLLPDVEACYRALVMGTRDYIQKCGFKKVVIALSGGIDSALTAAVVADAIGSENMVGVSLPSRYSSDGSKSDAEALAENMGIEFHTIGIEPAHHAIEEMLAPLFKGLEADVTEENIQARVRGNLMMALSNKLGALLVTTGNKSELAVGYCTLYGDMCGGLAVISDVPKTLVFDMCRWINAPGSPLFERFGLPVIPEATITKPPSAELRPDQKDEDSLPPYPVLDEIIQRYVEDEQSVGRIVEDTGFKETLVLRIVNLIDRNEYKRRQAAPGLKVTGRAFGFGRRMPMAQRYDNRRSLQRV